jgi:hypothetical protein
MRGMMRMNSWKVKKCGCCGKKGKCQHSRHMQRWECWDCIRVWCLCDFVKNPESYKSTC